MGPKGLGLLCTQLGTAGLIACQVPAFWCMKEPREAGLMTLLSIVKKIKGMMTGMVSCNPNCSISGVT